MDAPRTIQLVVLDWAGTPVDFGRFAPVDSFARALPDPARKPPPSRDTWTAASVEDQVRLAAAEMLGIPAEARTREALRGGNYPWPSLRGD